MDVGLDLPELVLLACLQLSRVSGCWLGAGNAAENACGLCNRGVWECGQTVLVKTCFLLMILACDQGRPALLHGATAGFWQAQARVVQAGTCVRPGL